MSHHKIRNIFNTILLDAVGASPTPDALTGLRVAVDNVAFEPETDEAYLQTHLIPADVDCETLSGDHRSYIGLFQVNVYTASSSATFESDNIIDALSDLFMLNKPFTGDDITFSVQPISPLQTPEGSAQDGWWRIPCWFRYRSDTTSKIYRKEP